MLLRVADLRRISDVVQARPGKLGNMAQSLDSGGHFDERAELGQALHRALDDVAGLDGFLELGP